MLVALLALRSVPLALLALHSVPLALLALLSVLLVLQVPAGETLGLLALAQLSMLSTPSQEQVTRLLALVG